MGPLCGWMGKMLRVDLGDGSRSILSTIYYINRFIGGRGLATRLYWDETGPETGALKAKNHLYFMNGPLAGTPAPAASRSVVLGKSPMAVPEQYAFGNLGGRFGAALKWSGLDGIAITGASPKPVIMVITPEGNCSIEDATGLWGKDAFETIAALEERFGTKCCVLTIGQAGEAKVRFATVVGSDGISATKGFGAVMGSKNLKALVVTGNKIDLPLAHPAAFKAIRKEISSLWKGDDSGRYWNELTIEDIEKVQDSNCYGCPGICRRGIYQSKKGVRGHRKPCVSAYFYFQREMDKTGRMAEATFYATQLANKHGLCVLELRFLVNWLPEALKRGLVDQNETGLDLNDLGTSEWIERLVDLIISRR
ncbi:MAG: aldehyde ferredoxin oxidoreductase N-terminal domain-containing protein, partial [Thermodesulfobacteriota bacterium]|nr:aldehyde ferredoxin oxidoreductase N-terminal domain-containing protein [Thermodesulfobacteriota bacterium]